MDNTAHGDSIHISISKDTVYGLDKWLSTGLLPHFLAAITCSSKLVLALLIHWWDSRRWMLMAGWLRYEVDNHWDWLLSKSFGTRHDLFWRHGERACWIILFTDNSKGSWRCVQWIQSFSCSVEVFCNCFVVPVSLFNLFWIVTIRSIDALKHEFFPASLVALTLVVLRTRHSWCMPSSLYGLSLDCHLDPWRRRVAPPLLQAVRSSSS